MYRAPCACDLSIRWKLAQTILVLAAVAAAACSLPAAGAQRHSGTSPRPTVAMDGAGAPEESKTDDKKEQVSAAEEDEGEEDAAKKGQEKKEAAVEEKDLFDDEDDLALGHCAMASPAEGEEDDEEEEEDGEAREHHRQQTDGDRQRGGAHGGGQAAKAKGGGKAKGDSKGQGKPGKGGQGGSRQSSQTGQQVPRWRCRGCCKLKCDSDYTSGSVYCMHCRSLMDSLARLSAAQKETDWWREVRSDPKKLVAVLKKYDAEAPGMAGRAGRTRRPKWSIATYKETIKSASQVRHVECGKMLTQNLYFKWAETIEGGLLSEEVAMRN